MERSLAFLRANPALIGMLVMFAILLGLGVFFTIMFRREGLSLRPLVFMGGFFGLVLLPQAAGHLAVAFGYLSAERLTWTPDGSHRRAASAASAAGGVERPALALDERALAAEPSEDGAPRYREPARVFGADVDARMTRDARAIYGEALADAEVAQLAVFAGEQMSIVATFASAAAARQAWGRMLGLLGRPVSPPVAHDAAATVRRASDLARLAVVGRALFLWSAPDEAALTRRAAAGDVLRPSGPDAAPAPADAPALATAAPAGRTPWKPSPLVLGVFLVVNLAAATVWFIRGGAWASEMAPAAGTPVLAASDVRARLLAAAPADVPWTIEPGRGPDEYVVTWRYADGRWLDMAGAHRIARVHRLRLRVDEAARVVWVREQWTTFSAELGRGGAAVQWRSELGITFFEQRAEWHVGLSFDEQGRPRRALNYAYRFDLQELKAPFIAAVTGAGWVWRPRILPWG